MAKKRRSKKAAKKEKHSGWISVVPRLPGIGAARAARLTVVVGVACAAWLGLSRLQRYVHSLPDYHVPVRLELADVPPWLQRSQNDHILQSIQQEGGISPEQSYLDDGLTRSIAEQLERSGWVRKVISVEKCYGGAGGSWRVASIASRSRG